MPACQFGRIARALLLLPLGALPLAAGASAQAPLGGSVYVYGGSYPHGGGQPIVTCFQSALGPSLNPVLAGGACSRGSGFYASAYSRRGIVGAVADAFGQALTFTYVTASWSDIVSWSNPLVSSIAFSFAVNGQVQQPAPYADIRYSFSYGSPPQRRSGSFFVNYGMPPDPFPTVLWQINAPVGGVTSLPFAYSLGILAYDSYADVWQGTGLTGLTFLDAGGNPINGVSYNFAAGTQFLGTQVPPNVSLAPEPGTMTSVGTALLALLGVLRRRGRASARQDAA